MQEEMHIAVITIFGKGPEAMKCMNCGKQKLFVLNLNEELFERYPKFWKMLNLALIEEEVYSSQLTAGPGRQKELARLLQLVLPE